MTLTAGNKLGPYEIQSPLGGGGVGEAYRARDRRLERHSFFADIFFPHFRVLRDVFGEHLDAFVRVGVEHFGAIFAQPIDPAAEIHGLADHYGANAKLADQAAAIPARSQRGHHDFVAVTPLPAGFAKRVRFAMRRRIALLHSAVVARSQQFPVVFEKRRTDRDSSFAES